MAKAQPQSCRPPQIKRDASFLEAPNTAINTAKETLTPHWTLRPSQLSTHWVIPITSDQKEEENVSYLCDLGTTYKKAICAVHSLLCGHDADPRYAEATVKARVAELYLPLLSLARDTLPRLHDFAGQQGRVGWGGFHHLGTWLIPQGSGQEMWARS